MCDDKHFQLGYKPLRADRKRKRASDKDLDAAWADATTVEQFKEDIEALARVTGAPLHAAVEPPPRRRRLTWR